MNHSNTSSIFDVPFYNGSQATLVDELYQSFPSLNQFQIVTANPEILMKTKKNNDYHTLVQQTNLVVPDGIGVVIASRLLKKPLQERITGFDLLLQFLSYANEQQLSVAFVGTTSIRLKKAVDWIKTQYPSIHLYAHHGYYQKENEATIIEELSAFHPDFLFVGTGAPAQDFFIHQYKENIRFKVGMGIGGCLDVLSGEVNRAPLLWQKCHLEWLYRMIQEPKRWIRFGQLPLFLLHVLVDKWRKNV